MRPIFYVSDGYPALTQTFTLREVRNLQAAGLPLTVVSLHHGGPSDPGRDPGRDPPVIDAPSPLSWRVVAAVLASAVRHPLRLARLLTLALLPHSQPFWPGMQLRAPLHVAWGCWLARRLPPHAHLHAQFLYGASSVAWAASELAGSTYSFTAHSDRSLLLVRPKLRRARRALAISEFERRRLLAAVPDVPPDRVVVHRLGVDVPESPKPPADRASGRLVALGSLAPAKGHDVLLRACRELVDRGVEHHLSIVGEGPERPSLERLLSSLGLRDHVTLCGAVPHAEALELLDASDVMALACHEAPGGDVDGIPVALMEAMAAGRAVVTTTVSALPELIEDGRTGLLVPPDDPPALADALQRVLEDDDLRKSLATAAHLEARRHWDAASSDARARELFTDLARP